jgi:hypothetical protein
MIQSRGVRQGVLVIGFLASIAGSSPAWAASVTYLTAAADPVHYKGPCPGSVRFVGTIHVSGPMTVSYRWERGDGGVTPPRKVSISGRSQNVETVWRLGTRAKAVRGSMRLRVLDPESLYSGEASFTVACGGAIDPMVGGRRPDD